MNGKSHFLYTSTFVRVLLNRGHEVTYLTSTSISMNEPNLANYTEVLIDPPQNMSAIGNLNFQYRINLSNQN